MFIDFLRNRKRVFFVCCCFFSWWLYGVFDRGAKIRFIYAEEVEPLVPVDLGNFGLGFKVFEKNIIVFVF